MEECILTLFKAKNFDLYYRSINGTRELNDRARKSKGKDNSGRNFYNTYLGWDAYKKGLLDTRSSVKQRINYYRKLQGLPPLAYNPYVTPLNNSIV